MPYALCNMRLVTSFVTSLKETLLYTLTVFPRPEFTRHASSQHVRFCQRQAGKVVRHPYHVLLVNHHTIGIFHDLIHFWMNRCITPAVANSMKAFDIRLHHTRAR